MQIIRQHVRTFVDGRSSLTLTRVQRVRTGEGLVVNRFNELVKRVAELAYANPEFVLLFRGQRSDHMNDNGTTLYPSMFRNQRDATDHETYPLGPRYERLQQCEADLKTALSSSRYRKTILRSQILRWAVIQHYEVCPTPCLDLTQSLLVAASFALNDCPTASEAFVFVLGVPQISGSVTVVSEHGLQLVRLSSICPAETMRPYSRRVSFSVRFR